MSGEERGSRISQVLAMFAIVGTLVMFASAHAQCSGSLGQILDPPLQRDLLTRYADLDIPDYPDLDNELLSTGRLERERNCLSIISEIVARAPMADPPSFAWPGLEIQLGGTHVRKYLIQVQGGAFAELQAEISSSEPFRGYPDFGFSVFDDTQVNGTVEPVVPGSEPSPAVSPYGDEITAFPQLEMFMVRTSTMRQFARLAQDLEVLNRRIAERHATAPQGQLAAQPGVYVHLTENFPMQAAAIQFGETSLGTAKASTGVDVFTTLGFDGDGYAIAILDSGVDPAYFPAHAPVASTSSDSKGDDGVHEPVTSEPGTRIIYQACFSSQDLQAVTTEGEQIISPLCPNGGRDENVATLYTVNDATPSYTPFITEDGDGGPCQISSPNGAQIDEWPCLHGTRVAYIAAGEPVPGKGSEDSGMARGVSIISLRVVSRAPDAYCGGDQLSRTCVAYMPVDVLRALHHLDELLDAQGRYEGSTVVAANLSFHLSEWCGSRAQSTTPDCPPNKWALRSYSDPCTGPFADRVQRLLDGGIWTVIAAGNLPKEADEGTRLSGLGIVSKPGCVLNAITVGATFEDDSWHSRTKLAHFVDFMAPGYSINYMGRSDSGTSLATPFVTGALVLARQFFDQCGPVEPFDNENDWLASHRSDVSINPNDIHEDLRPGAESYLELLGLALEMRLELSIPEGELVCGNAGKR